MKTSKKNKTKKINNDNYKTWFKINKPTNIAIISAIAACLAAGAAIWQGNVSRHSLKIAQESLDVVLAQSRPFFMLHGELKDGIIIIRIINKGPVPGRMISKSFGLWTDGIRKGTPPINYSEITVVFPDADITTMRLDFNDQMFQSRKNEKKSIGIGTCIIYESVEPGDNRHWMAELWIELNPEKDYSELGLLKVDDKPIENINDYNLENIMPDGWEMQLN